MSPRRTTGIFWLVIAVLAAACSSTSVTRVDETVYSDADQVVTRSTVGDLVRASGVILIGTVRAQSGTRNMARDVKDSRREDAFYIVLGRDYTLDVERVLKGQTSGSTTLTIASAHGNRKDGVIPDRDFVPPVVGQRYLFFLSPQPDGSAGFVPAPEPFRFRLTSVATAESRWEFASVAFPARPVEDLVREVVVATGP